MPPDSWFGQQAVYRISMGNFVSVPSTAVAHGARSLPGCRWTLPPCLALRAELGAAPLPAQVLFGCLAAVMVGVQHKGDRRARVLHHGHWLVKGGLWALCNALPFLLPNGVVAAYSWLARFGSPLFLLIQMVILLVGTPPLPPPCTCTLWEAWACTGCRGCLFRLAGVACLCLPVYPTPRALATRPPPPPTHTLHTRRM